jgi:hypothetical protein
MGAVCWAVQAWVVAPLHDRNLWAFAAGTLANVALGGAVYLGAAATLRMSEIASAKRILLSRKKPNDEHIKPVNDD